MFWLCVPCLSVLQPDQVEDARPESLSPAKCPVCREDRAPSMMRSVTRETLERVHWDPWPQDRQYFREVSSGQLGWLVRRQGKDHIRLDHGPNVDTTRPFTHEWVPDNETRALNIGQLGQVVFEADKALCRFIGLQQNSLKSWDGLTDQQRQAWMERGPETPIRADLWRGIKESLGRHTR